jgi:glycosyltransferase involved in cell wall biosynthesis
MHRIPIDGDVYVAARLSDTVDPGRLNDAVRAAVATARGENGLLPSAVVWDARMHARLGEALVRISDGLLDELLLSQIDASGCCAVLESVLERLKGRGAIQKLEQTGDALAILARDPQARVAHAADIVGEIGPEQLRAGQRKMRPAGRPDLISIAVLVNGDVTGVEAFVDAAAAQQLTSEVELLVVGCGVGRREARALSDALDRRTSGPRSLRVRQFLLPGEMGEATLANTAMTLASGEVVVLAHPRCTPETAQTIQILAGWAMANDVLTVSPRILDGSATLLAAGLTAAEDETRGTVLKPWSSPALADVVRRTAAPAPWFFAVNRRAWLACGGVDPRADGLWTASLARPAGENCGRRLLVGNTAAVWLAPDRPAALKSHVRVRALSDDARRAPRLLDAGAAVGRALDPEPLVRPGSAAFPGAFPTSAPMRLLVFADGYGASQSIAFVEGLADARARRQAAVRIVEEAAFGPDGPRFDAEHVRAVVAEHFAEVSPTVVVLSRFGHAGAYEIVLEETVRCGASLLFHIDDDLFELPPCVGIERYRSARHPRRIHTLHRGMAEADLVLATTQPLAARLGRIADPERIDFLQPGAAGEPRPRGPAKGSHAPLVIGYMGSASHNHDLEMIVPALNAILGRFDHVSVELFGSISDQPAAELIRGRVRRRKAVAGDYGRFKQVLGGLGWDIGLAPLRPIAYNLCKTPTKWVEYAEAGIVPVVSDLEVYRPMIAAEAAVPAQPDEWESAIARLITAPGLRHELQGAADRLLRERYSWGRLEGELLGMLGRLRRPALAAE